MVPVGETEFARDATFGYSSSNLKEFVAEASGGAVASADVVSISDGGGQVVAARKEIGGPERVAHFLLGVLEKFGQGVTPVPVEVNGSPAVLGLRDGAPMALWTVDVGADGIHRVFIVLNPQKLSRFEALPGLS